MGKAKDMKKAVTKAAAKANKAAVKCKNSDQTEPVLAPSENNRIPLGCLTQLGGGIIGMSGECILNDNDDPWRVDSVGRNVFYSGPITQEGVKRCISQLRGVMSGHLSDDIIRITLFLNSAGGDMDAAFALVDFMNRMSQKIRVVGQGRIMSAATIILAAAADRRLDVDASVMVHGCTLTTNGGVDFSVMGRELAADDDLAMAKVYSARGPYSTEEWMGLMRTGLDAHFSSENAVAAGIADKVVDVRE